MTTKLEQTVTTEEWEQALEIVRKQAVEIDRLRETARTLAEQSQEKEREIIGRDDQIFKLETELDRLRGLLGRWATTGKALTFELRDSPELDELIEETTEALK